MTTVVSGSTPESISLARRAARALADSLTPAPDPAHTETLVLVVSELVTNALRHGGGRYTLRLSARPDTVTAAVSDPSPTRPRERAPDLEGGGGGFGWHMIRSLVSQLSITPGPGTGKTIHVQLAR